VPLIAPSGTPCSPPPWSLLGDRLRGTTLGGLAASARYGAVAHNIRSIVLGVHSVSVGRLSLLAVWSSLRHRRTESSVLWT
jgi:hypothetical protein